MMSTRTMREAFFKEVGQNNDDIGSLSNGITVGKTSNTPLPNSAGFSNLPNQIHRSTVRQGFVFNLMVVGASGMGKSTFINSLFLGDIYDTNYPGPSKRPHKTTTVEESCYLLKENGVELKLTIVDTPGFGDAVDNDECWVPLVDYISARYDEQMRSEHLMERPSRNLSDRRIHACLYFIAPNGHGLRALDIAVLKHLSHKVNVIPLIAKADTFTVEECSSFKKILRSEFSQNQIRIYDFPESDIALAGDELEQAKMKKLRDRAPFAVVGSNALVPNTKKRGRVYPWGVVEIDNLEHNDFLALRTLLLRIHMQDLIESTECEHYENHRQSILRRAAEVNNFSKDPLLQLEEERVEYERTLHEKELEMEHVFESKVNEKISRLNDMEASNKHRIEQMQKQLHQEESELAERTKQLQLDRAAWEQGNAGSVAAGNVGEWRNSSPSSSATLTSGGGLEKSKSDRKKKSLF